MTPQYGTVLYEKRPAIKVKAIVMVLNRAVNIQLTRVLVLNSEVSPWLAGLPDNQMADWEELGE